MEYDAQRRPALRDTTRIARHPQFNIDNYNKAIVAYRPKPYSGPATVFKAASTHGPDDMGWAKLVTGPLDVRVLPGDHYSLIKAPEVAELVRELSASIDRALSRRAVEAV